MFLVPLRLVCWKILYICYLSGVLLVCFRIDISYFLGDPCFQCTGDSQRVCYFDVDYCFRLALFSSREILGAFACFAVQFNVALFSVRCIVVLDFGDFVVRFLACYEWNGSVRLEFQ